jgi:hypothetical protein
VTLACKMTNNSLMLVDIADAAVAMIEDITAVCGVAWRMTLTYNKNRDSILFLTIIYTSHHTTPQWSARLVAPWRSFSSEKERETDDTRLNTRETVGGCNKRSAKNKKN